MRWPTFVQIASLLIGLLSATMLSGCRLGAAAPMTIAALDADGALAQLKVPQTTAVFREADGAIDAIISDLPPEQLRALANEHAAAPAQFGVILHAHMFLNPQAGRTPISFDASNAAFTMLILSGPDAGVYGGGGFLLPSTLNPGNFSARTRDATLRLIGHTEGFVDQLGSGDLRGGIRARADTMLTEDGLRLIAGAVQQLPAPEPEASHGRR